MASGSTPVSGLPYPNGNDGFGVAGDMQALATALDSKVVLSFASASDRSSKAPSAQDGAWCYLRDSRTYETYNAASGGWTWPKWGRGLLAQANYVEQGGTPPAPGRTPLSNELAGLPAFNVSVPFIPAGRRLRVSFSGNISADQGGTGYQFLMIFAGIQRRLAVNCPVADVNFSFYLPYVFTTPTSYTGMTGGILTGGRLYGPGNCYLHTTSYDGPTQFLVEDLGAA